MCYSVITIPEYNKKEPQKILTDDTGKVVSAVSWLVTIIVRGGTAKPGSENTGTRLVIEIETSQS